MSDLKSLYLNTAAAHITLAAAYTAMAGAVSSSDVPEIPAPGNVPTLPGAPAAGATDQNAYPLTWPAGNADAASVVLGQGPNTLELIYANSPGQDPPLSFNVVLVAPDGSMKGIAGPLTSTSFVGEASAGAQSLQIKGPWAQGSKFMLTPAGGGAGTNGMFIHAASLDMVPLGIFGSLNSRGGQATGQTTIYISNNGTATLAMAKDMPQAQAGTSAGSGFTGTPTLISGKTLREFVAVGGTITLPAETIVGTCTLPVATDLGGAGAGKTIIEGTGIEPAQDKALVVPNGAAQLHDMTIQGAYIPAALGLNAAGIRNADSTVPLVVSRVEIRNCQNGILTDGVSAGPFTFHNLHIHDCGEVTKPGNTHNAYIGGTPAASCLLVDSVSEGCRDGHAWKCRTGTFAGSGNTITAGGNGSCYDFPNGGSVTIVNETWTLPAGAADRNFLTYAMENAANAAVGKTVTLTNVLLDDQTGQGGFLQNGDKIPDAILTLESVTYRGAKPELRGWGQVIGDIAPAAA